MLKRSLTQDWLKSIQETEKKPESNCKQKLHGVWISQLRERRRSMVRNLVEASARRDKLATGTYKA